VKRPSTATVLRFVVGAPAAVMFVVFVSFLVRGWSSADVPNLHAPPGSASAPPETTPTTGPNLAAVQLAAVDGTTTRPAAPTSGTAHLSGSVNAPEGFVPGATVRAERVLDTGDLQRFDAVAGPDGHWDLPNIPGGRYRVRAFLAPQLAQTEAELFFLADGEQRTVDLTVERFDSSSIAVGVAPDPPVAGQPVNVVVQVAVRTVDADGVVHATPTPGIIVSIASPGSWTLRSPAQSNTGADGQVTFEMVCRSAGPNQLQIVARTADPAKPPVQQAVGVPDCVEPAAAPTTAPPGSSPTSSPPSSVATTTTAPGDTTTTAK
jgi:hypothetical protein